jgi:hypothetical protein
MSRTSLCVAACVAVCGVAYLAAPGQAPARQGAAPVLAQRVKQKWEHKAVADRRIVDYAVANAGGKSLDDQRTEAWNKLGDDGWELFAVGDVATDHTYYFKRPK